jgi:hypothetical protein
MIVAFYFCADIWVKQMFVPLVPCHINTLASTHQCGDERSELVLPCATLYCSAARALVVHFSGFCSDAPPSREHLLQMGSSCVTEHHVVVAEQNWRWYDNLWLLSFDPVPQLFHFLQNLNLHCHFIHNQRYRHLGAQSCPQAALSPSLLRQ